MKRTICLLLALVMTLCCLAGVCFAADPIAVVIHGSEQVKIYDMTEAKALINPDGTSVVKMLKDHVIDRTVNFLYDVYTFTLDLNGHTAGGTAKTAVGVTKLGSKNTTTVIKNGTLIGGSENSVAVNIQQGGMRIENVTMTSYSANTVLGIYQLKGDWNADNLITGCTIIGYEGSAVRFTSTTDPQTDVSVKFENTTLVSTRFGAGWGRYAFDERSVPGGSIELGKNVHIYTPDKMAWINPNLTAKGETPVYQGKNGSIKVPALDMTFTNYHHWSTADGGMKNTTVETFTAPAETGTPSTTPVVQTATFADVPVSFWGFDAIDAAFGAGLVKGKSTAASGKMNYAPNDTMTRAEFLTTVMRFFYADDAAKVSQDGAKWWQGYYDLAVSKGVLKAAELENGALDKPMTREEMALVLHRTAPSMTAYKGVKKTSVSNIPDYKTITNVYKDAALWVYGAGLIQGMDENGTFAPQQSLTRAQSAAILAKLVAKGNSTVEHLIPEMQVEETQENRTKAVMEFAWAYNRKGFNMQYDTSNLSVLGRSGGCRTTYRELSSPEHASDQRTIFTHCCFAGYNYIYQAFGHELTGSWINCVVARLAEVEPSVAPYAVYHYTTTGDFETDKAGMQKMFDTVREGDLVCYTRTTSTTPHVILWADDLDGDGDDDFINIGGTNYDTANKQEIREINGASWVNTWRWDCQGAEDFFSNPANTADYFMEDIQDISLIRFTDPKHAATDPLTERAKTRLLYPGLDINYEVGESIYDSAVKGGELDYVLTLTNTSKQDYKGLKVNLPVPENATVVKVDGTAVSNGIVSRAYDIAAGKSVTLTVTVKATGKVGDIISTGVGYVHAIPLPQFFTGIVSQKADAAKVQAALESAKGLSGAEFLKAYLAAMKLDVNIPALAELQDALFTTSSEGGYKLMRLRDKASAATEDKELANMVIPWFFGGQYVVTEGSSYRVTMLRNQDLQAGDIVIWQESSTITKPFIAVHNGEVLTYAEDGELKSVRQQDLDKVIRYRFFVGLRPTQAK